MIEIRKSVESDIAYLAKNVRKADLMEINATGTADPFVSFQNGYDYSRPYAMTMVIDGRPAAMCGTTEAESMPEIGCIWLLGTDAISEINPLGFLRSCKRELLPALIRPYKMLYNIVDARNTVHIDFIKWLGFSIIRSINFGPENLEFYEFAMINKEATNV